MTVLYHKKLPGMSLDEGYIGITEDIKVRNEQHERAAHILESPYTVHHMMRIHKDKYETVILEEGDRKDISNKEYKLRPHWHIAWNMAPGGGNLGGWKNISEWLDEYLYQPNTGNWIRVLNYSSPSSLAKDIFGSSNKRPYISGLLKGKLSNINGWELQNSQIVERVKDRLTIKYPYYIKKIGQSKVDKILENGSKELSKYNNIIPGRASWTQLYIGNKDKLHGYEKANEYMYKLNPGIEYGK